MLDREGHSRRWGRQDSYNVVREPTAVASEMGPVLDIAATWHSSLNVCRTKSGVYFWAEWLGQNWKCPSPWNFPYMDSVFALGKGKHHDSIMYRPLLMPEQEGSLSLTSGFSEQFNEAVNIPCTFILLYLWIPRI